MAKDPAFLFYSQDFIVGVQTMDFEDRGKYITILALMHQQGRMKEKTIRFLVGSVSENLESKFQIDKNGYWYNLRLEEETKKRKIYTESRRINGLKGGRPKKNGSKIIKHCNNHMDNHMGNENEDENENINESESGNEIKIISNEKFEFEKVRKLYPGTKRGLETEFNNFLRHRDWKSILPLLLGSLEYQIDQKSRMNDFVPAWANFQTWINQKKWEEKIIINSNTKNKHERLNTLEQETIESIRNQYGNSNSN